jgi:hypothetical protein
VIRTRTTRTTLPAGPHALGHHAREPGAKGKLGQEAVDAAKQKWSQDRAKWNAYNQDTKDGSSPDARAGRISTTA